jgi:hypothetical protein
MGILFAGAIVGNFLLARGVHSGMRKAGERGGRGIRPRQGGRTGAFDHWVGRNEPGATARSPQIVTRGVAECTPGYVKKG